MPSTKKPHSGSMQFWPRVRSKRVYARVNAWADNNEAKLLGFAGYKVGMTHILYTDGDKNSPTKGMDVTCPVTIIECPPIKTASIIFYKNTPYGKQTVSQILAENLDKELARKIVLPKKAAMKADDVKEFDDIRLLVHTQPKMTGIGKKKPELFEVGIGGKKDEKLAYAKEVLGKEIKVSDILAEGMQLDTHGITKGKGYQGPVKRFGVSIRRHKSEKMIRGPANLGSWEMKGKRTRTIAHAGKMGYHPRVEYNKQILKMGDNPEDVNPKGGFKRYGLVKGDYIIVKGGIIGPAKRIVRLNHAIRPNAKVSGAPEIKIINTESHQG